MELKIEYLPITALKPYERNTRKHAKKDIENIARSIEKYGMCDAIGIWGEQNIIVEGHGRMMACKQLGITEVPCVRLDHLTDEQRREYAIAHNATAELSEWDFSVLFDEATELDLSDFDFDFVISDESTIDTPSEISEEQYKPVGAPEDKETGERGESEPSAPTIDSELLSQFKGHEAQFLAKKRVIITYLPAQEEKLREILRVNSDTLKVVYDITELVDNEKTDTN